MPLPPLQTVWLSSLSPAVRAELDSYRGRPLQSTPDVLVVGGGLIGLATAYFLAERGLAVQVVESETLAAGASGANAGGIWPNDQGPSHSAAFHPLAFASRDLWGRLSVRPEFDIDWRVSGFLNVNPEKFPPSATEFAAKCQELGYTVHAVDAEQIALLEPNLKPGLMSGLHCPSDAHLNPVKSALSFARGLLQRRGQIATGVRAISIQKEAGRIISVETTNGRISPRHVVCATGWTAEWLKGTIAKLPPLCPVRGQMIATAPVSPLLKGPVAGKVLAVQLRSGEIVCGATVEESDNLVPDPAVSQQFADAARDLIPALKGVAFLHAWCGLRPATPDSLPIIDRVADCDNLWLSGGHFRNGVLLAPASGKLVAEWIATGRQPDDLRPFSASRFG